MLSLCAHKPSNLTTNALTPSTRPATYSTSMLARVNYALIWSLLLCKSSAALSAPLSFPTWRLQSKEDIPSHVGLLAQLLPRFDANEFDKGCFASASREVYVECEHLTFAEHEMQRSRYAVRLTLCELYVAGVTPPVQCQTSRHEGDLRICLHELELRPQWWTTFSGYFREAQYLASMLNQ